MYNLKNLNDYEYEVLCLDAMSKILKKKLYRFARGKDGGIDICDNIDNPKIIIQVKQYSNSKYSNLKSVIKNEEFKKIQRICPDEYYLCTSMELTRENKKELYEILNPYMKEATNIIDGVEMNDFLEQEDNIDIVKKNYKLWINSTNVLSLINNKNVFIDCDELMYDIENHIKSFVETEGYIEAYNKLNKENIIIIIGGPGVGKSTISKMILLKYASDGYKVRYTTDNNISNIKNILSMDNDSKEIVLLDDFLGQHYLNLKESEPNELKTLLSFIHRNKNKKLILNSRITILNEAKNRYINFNELIEEYETNTYLINLDNMKKVEKAKILYNHMFFNNITREHFINIKEDKRYLNIVKHNNYNPRIIEYVTKGNRYKSIDPKQYYNYIIKNLDNPKDVWKDEFENRLSTEDRTLMLILYSLTNNYIEINILREVYNKSIKGLYNIDSSLNTFDRVIYRLSDSLIVKLEDSNRIKVGVLNPSINDYIKNELDLNVNEQMYIAHNAIYVEQLLKFSDSEAVEEIIKEKVISGDLLRMKVLSKSIFYYYIEQIYKYKILSEEIKELVILAFERSYENINSLQEKREYGNMIINFIKSNQMIQFYNLDQVLHYTYKMNFILQKLELDNLESFMDEYIELYQNITDSKKMNDMLDLFKQYTIAEIENEIQKEAEMNLDNSTYEIVEEASVDEIESYTENGTGSIKNKVSVRLSNYIYDKMLDMIARFSRYITIDEEEINAEQIEEAIDIDSYIESNINYINKNNDIEETFMNYENEDEEIKNIFERDIYENN